MTQLLLADENFPAPSIHLMRSVGLDVLAIGESHHGMDDRELVGYFCVVIRSRLRKRPLLAAVPLQDSRP